MAHIPLSNDWHNLFAHLATDRETAEQQLIETITPGLRLMVRRRLRARSNVEDVVQEVLLAVISNLRRHCLRNECSLPAYIRGIAHRKIADVISQMPRMCELPDVVTDHNQSQEAVAQSHQRRALLLAALSQLVPRDRDILRRWYTLDQSTEEIAAAMGLSPTRIRTLRARAVERLKHAMELMSQKNHCERVA